jgi:hypothetical protein
MFLRVNLSVSNLAAAALAVALVTATGCSKDDSDSGSTTKAGEASSTCSSISSQDAMVVSEHKPANNAVVWDPGTGGDDPGSGGDDLNNMIAAGPGDGGDHPVRNNDLINMIVAGPGDGGDDPTSGGDDPTTGGDDIWAWTLTSQTGCDGANCDEASTAASTQPAVSNNATTSASNCP